MRISLLSIALLISFASASCGGSVSRETTTTTTTTTSMPDVAPPTPVGGTANAADEKSAKAALDLIYKAVTAGDKKMMHTYFVYRGEDEGRKWNDFYNPADPNEKLQLEKEWAHLEMLFTGTTGFKVTKSYTESESEGVWNILVVKFDGTSSADESTFAFLKVKDVFAIGDID